MVFVGRMVPILVWMTQTVMVPVDTSLEVMGTAVSIYLCHIIGIYMLDFSAPMI